MDIYVTSGQSNMVGVEKGSTPLSHPDRIFVLNPQDGSWAPARDPLYVGYGVGPGVSFADTLAGLTGREIGIVPAAVSGTTMLEWTPSLGPTVSSARTNLYGFMFARAVLAMKTAPIKGFLWYQGEGDSTVLAYVQAYSIRMHSLFNALRIDFQNLALPIVFTQLGPLPSPTLYPYWTTIQAWQALIEAGNYPNLAMVSAKDLTPIVGNPEHLNVTSQITLGQRMAHAMFALTG